MNLSLDVLLEDEVLLQCRLNGRLCEELVTPGVSLLEFVREHKGLTGTHMGCMTGHCGACTVMVDERVAKSCLCAAATVQGKAIMTLEGLAGNDGTLHPVQEAFDEANAFQCGFCAPGMILTTVELLKENPDPSDDDIRAALAGNLCRCTGYRSIVAGVRLAARRLREQAQGARAA
jgi:carbon-monoxide dehydrogenase small subunit